MPGLRTAFGWRFQGRAELRGQELWLAGLARFGPGYQWDYAADVSRLANRLDSAGRRSPVRDGSAGGDRKVTLEGRYRRDYPGALHRLRGYLVLYNHYGRVFPWTQPVVELAVGPPERV